MLSEKFIGASHDFSDYGRHVPAPLLRRSFNLEAVPVAATLTLCGLGFYELYCNGERITKGALAPYISNPDDVLYYDRYDLSGLLRPGENVIGVMLGNGFMNPFGGRIWDFEKAAWRGAPRVALALEADGALLFEADERFAVAPSPVTFDEYRVGAFYDARLERPGWAAPGYDAGDWATAIPLSRPRGEARLCEAQPVLFCGSRRPVSIRHFDDTCFCVRQVEGQSVPVEQTRVKDVYLYDFGENNSGVCRLTIRGKRGQTVKLRYGEKLQDGALNIVNIIFPRPGAEFYFDYPQMDMYTCKGEGTEQYLPPFTYHGFRYVLVEGITPEQATEDLLTYEVMCSAMPTRGGFTCSDETVNRLYELTVRSDHSNFVYIPTDCPHREKNGWTADAALSAEHMLQHMDALPSMREWVRNIAKAQNEAGALPGIVPTAGWGFEWGNGPAWDSVCIYYPYYCYQYDGDTQIIREARNMMRRYLRYVDGRRDENGLLAIGLGDWCQPGSEDGRPYPLAPLVVTDSVVVLDLARKAAHLFAAIGDGAAEQEARALADSMRTAIRAHLIDFDTVTVAGECQTSQVMALAYGLLEEAEKPAAVQRLVEYIHQYGDHLMCGVVGGRQIFHVLAENGYADLALHMITRPDAPSYGHWLEEGATTLFEDFSGASDCASQNHHFWGDIASFFVKRLAGLHINPRVRDTHEVAVAPHFVAALAHAGAYFDLPDGRVSVDWKRDGGDILLTVEAPTTAHGKMRLPDGWHFADGTAEKPLTPGTYTITE